MSDTHHRNEEKGRLFSPLVAIYESNKVYLNAFSRKVQGILMTFKYA